QISSSVPRSKRSVKVITFAPAFRSVIEISGESIDSSRKHASRGTRRSGSAPCGLVADDLLDFLCRAMVFLCELRDRFAGVEALRDHRGRNAGTGDHRAAEPYFRVHLDNARRGGASLFRDEGKQLDDSFTRGPFFNPLKEIA